MTFYSKLNMTREQLYQEFVESRAGLSMRFCEYIEMRRNQAKLKELQR